MEANVPFAAVDERSLSELAQDAGTGELRSLVYMHAMERKYDALEKQLQEAMNDVEKHKHQCHTLIFGPKNTRSNFSSIPDTSSFPYALLCNFLPCLNCIFLLLLSLIFLHIKPSRMFSCITSP